MPLARILTAFPERAESLAHQLKDQGYTVEFLSPEKAGMLRADLEIDFEICDQNVVLRRATELANKLHVDIAVSPEALPASIAESQSQIYDGQNYDGQNQIVEVPSHLPDPYVETFLAQGERTGQIHNLEQSEHMVSLPPDMLASQGLSQEQLVEPIAQSSLPAEPMQARTEERAQIEARAQIEQPIRSIEVPFVPDPERYAEGTYGFETHASPANVHDSAQLHDSAQTHDSAQMHAPVNVHGDVLEPVVRRSNEEWMERAGAISASALAAGRQKSASLLASLRRFGSDCAEWINVRVAAAQDKRHQRQIEAEKQREIARLRAEELEVARDAAAARLQELLRERGGLTDQQPVPPAATGPIPTSGPIPAYRSEPRLNEPQVASHFAQASWFERLKDIALTRKYGQQWEAVLMGVAAACALFVVGVAVNSFRPHPALSNTITQPSSAAATPVSARANSTAQPYNGVTVKAGTPGVTLLPSPAKAGTPSSAQVGTNKPSPKESDVTVRHFGNTARLTSRRSDGSIAQDVTIRHFNQQPKPAARNSTDGVKRYSDLD